MTACWLVVSDVDHTLLEVPEQTAELGHVVRRIAQRGIPTLLASSKTFAEMVDLQNRASLLPQPFLFENGCGIGWPLPAWPGTQPPALVQDGYGALVRGEPPAAQVALLRRLREEANLRFTLLKELSLAEIRELTGLEERLADLALARLASVPLLWQDRRERLSWLQEQLEERGLRAVQGGKLLHVGPPFDKGEAFQELAPWSALQPWPARRLACGDSENDRSLLEGADIALVFHPPDRPPLKLRPAPPGRQRVERAVVAAGPRAWLEAVEAALEQPAP
jgi:mannosyl-3-phosphoglycerate phosphatase family protein